MILLIIKENKIMSNFEKIKSLENSTEMAKYLSNNIFIIFNSSLTKKKFYEETLNFLNERCFYEDKREDKNDCN